MEQILINIYFKVANWNAERHNVNNTGISVVYNASLIGRVNFIQLKHVIYNYQNVKNLVTIHDLQRQAFLAMFSPADELRMSLSAARKQNKSMSDNAVMPFHMSLYKSS